MPSPLQTQEAEASANTATPPSPIPEPIPSPAVGPPISTTTPSALVSAVGGPTSDAEALDTSAAITDADSLAQSRPTSRELDGSANQPLQDPVQAKLVPSPGYVVSAPSFSYSVFPRVNSPAGASQQSSSIPALKLTPPMPAAALQPPVPGQPLGNRPSFSYNVSSQAIASSASGQQFRPPTVTSQMQLQGINLRPSTSAASLQPPVPGQPLRPTPTNTVIFAHSFPRPVGQLSASSNFSFGESAQPTLTTASPRSLNSKDGISSVVASGVSSVESVSSQSVKTSSSMPASSSVDSFSPSPVTNSPNLLTSTPSLFTPRPGMSAVSVTTGHPAAPNSSANQPTAAVPSPLQPFVPSPAVLSSLPSVPVPPQLMVQQQIYSSYSFTPNVPLTSMAPWLHHPPAGGLPHAPFSPYPGVRPALFPSSMQGTAVPSVPSPIVHPPGVSADVHSGLSTSGESFATSKSTAVPLPPSIDHDEEVNDLHKHGETTKNEVDVWTAHKTESGTIYYYNSITGQSTYEKPSCFKGEPEKIADQPNPVTWEKIPGTNWTLVTTNDGKKYYHDTKNKVSSWQVPPEVVEMRKNSESDTLKLNTAQEENTIIIEEKVSAPVNISTPALHTGGRDPMAIRSSGGQVSSSALDLIKKKLQEAGTPVTSTPVPPSTISTTTELNGSGAVDTVAKGQQQNNSKDKEKDANVVGNMSDSSSDSDDGESGPSKEECIIQFKEMLKERGVAPFSKWDKELPKIAFDPRFKAVPNSARRSIFEHFVRTRAEEERKEKRAAQKAAIDGFKQLLEDASEDIDDKTDYQTFKRKWGTDPRFEALDRKEREMLLNEKLLPLKKAAEEKNQAVRTAAVSSFKSMLRENKDITVNSRWSKVKDSLRSDRRYKSVKHEEREILFNDYISELKAAADDEERAAKAKRDEHDKLKEREREMRKRKEREEQEMERIRVKVRRKEAISSYQALLVETIKDPKASWTESKPKLEKDPQGRATNPDLSEADMEKLFRDHVRDLLERCARDYRYLLAEVITMEAAAKETDDGKNVLNSWTEAKNLLKHDPRYSKMPRKDRESLWIRHADDLIRKQKMSSDQEKPKDTLEREGRNKSSGDFSRRSPRRSHGRR